MTNIEEVKITRGLLILVKENTVFLKSENFIIFEKLVLINIFAKSKRKTKEILIIL